MSYNLLDSIPIWAVFAGLFLIFHASVECGRRLGAWRRSHVKATDGSWTIPDGAGTAAILTMVGFLLAFTFATAGSYFNDRRQLVIDDANAIGTTFLRAEHLTEPYRSTARRLLGEYVENRHLVEKKSFHDFVTVSERLQEQLWTEATAAAQTAPTPITALFIGSLNEMIDLHKKRADTDLWIRIPPMVFAMLAFLSVLAMVMTGYAQGLGGRRYPISTALVIVAYATVFLLVVDLDRPVKGLFFVSQEPMIELRDSIRADLAEQPPS